MKNPIKSVLLGATLLATATPAFADEIIFAHGANPGNPRYDAAQMFAALVPACTAGETTVNVAASATLGNDVEMLTSTSAGVIQITANSQGPLAQIVPEVGMLGLPFLFADLPAVWSVVDGEVGDMIDEKAQMAGLKVLTFWDNGIRHVSHVDKNVPTPADLEGMQIRTPSDEVTIATFEALGASPAPLAWSELPTALQSGVFAGQENPLTNIYSAKLHEITPYITLTGHKYESTPVLASMVWWSGLDEATQDCIQGAAKSAGWYQRGQSLMQGAALRETMAAEGAIFAEVEDRQAFIDATAPVYEKYEGQFGDLIATLREATQ
ncbi:2,3-diketo-L-gulonate-binding periplasmic protein YiaO precursor [Aquimixticola soesokkakensis]|uniref:2,3-diketo-L-gulonate-binding periplasmic protein YiaO n=1 Tax=Aquimixticola soesokkakensis TaxID=1519096 RepID=A0A1Y5TIR8_9RHOB|nr:TRAP transporter substrate-binding protein [Aquimixticola soesokkakensis]SLN62891.1 2,3-diketo-L-gulonate-binding periplasmic protein YiaO precursor [Aquimixticola soesokkakensis]